MRYPPRILDEIRARLPVSAVVGKRVRLKKAGREWKGLSPFNAEKTPSFFVNDQKRLLHCFSSGKHGDIFTFLMETEGLSFPEAVERLAGEAGVALPKVSARGPRRRRSSARRLHDVDGAGGRSSSRPSCRAASAAKARGTISPARGLGRRDRSARFRHRLRAPRPLRAARPPRRQGRRRSRPMIEAGPAGAPARTSPVPFDRFRDRVMFPICDVRGRVDRLRRPGA